MPTTEAQKRATAKWNANNKDKIREWHKKWADENREHLNDVIRKNNKKYYWRDKEFAIFRQILLNPWSFRQKSIKLKIIWRISSYHLNVLSENHLK